MKLHLGVTQSFTRGMQLQLCVTDSFTVRMTWVDKAEQHYLLLQYHCDLLIPMQYAVAFMWDDWFIHCMCDRGR